MQNMISNGDVMLRMSDIKKQFDNLVENCMRSGEIDQTLYSIYDVKRGLRDSNGKGVLTGLTEVSDVVSMEIKDGEPHPKVHFHTILFAFDPTILVKVANKLNPKNE